jgi:hypothetical protein
MTRFRWGKSETVKFPPPDFVISGRAYWYRKTIRAFLKRHNKDKSGRGVQAMMQARKVESKAS